MAHMEVTKGTMHLTRVYTSVAEQHFDASQRLLGVSCKVQSSIHFCTLLGEEGLPSMAAAVWHGHMGSSSTLVYPEDYMQKLSAATQVHTLKS